MKEFINSLRISCSVIGAVIGAGFITGREIMRFFYGNSPILGVIVLFCVLFITIYFILKVQNAKIIFLLEKSSIFIYSLNLLIMASMLGATDSLAFSLFGLPTNIPILSILLLVLSTLLSLNGMDRLTHFNFIIVPVMLAIFFLTIFILPKSEYVIGKEIVIEKDCFLYGFMNIFLMQPFLLKIKKEKRKFSPFLVSIVSSIILSVAILLFLGILSDECISCEVPIILLARNNIFIYYSVSIVIFLSIFTTLTSVQYPFYIQDKPFGYLPLIFSAVFSFAVSRIGFYIIVDKIYPLIAVLSFIYYAFIFAIWLFFFLKGQQLRTLSPQANIKSRYLPLQDQA